MPVDGQQNRARSRDSLLLVAKLQLGNERGIREVRVRNLSEGGLMLELDKVVDVGTPVRLDLRGIGETTGKVAWCTQGRMGIALDSPIDPKKARKPIGGTKPASTPFYAKGPGEP
ncbi:PilZ domain-containing protein [Sphingomonas sp. 4RDLI-65]|uniref:PilZ domain-containing protein n=1 Tax=Sphingomonas sp. 4RDLI-65 TaxID=3111641 RepID=UPI003C2E6B6F